MVKNLLFVVAFFTVFGVFAQEANISESIVGEETRQNKIEQYSSADVVNTDTIENAEQINVYVLERIFPRQ